MTTFLLGVLSSLLATATLVAAGWVRSSRPRWWLAGILARLTGTGIVRLYREQRSAEQDMAHDLTRARWVRIMAGRGNALTRDVFSPLWTDGAGRSVPVQVLLPDHEAQPGVWLARREKDLGRADPGFGQGLLKAQVRANTDYLAEVTRQRSGIELRLFDLPNAFRIVATDRAAYLTLYGRHAHGRHSPCLYVRAPGVLYDSVLDLFDSVWAGSFPASSGTPPGSAQET
ncbi:hypothetical protein [Nocardiopsis alkaliphila]|uniref:hypothetical protein n=1 Tax=Nocardiopsis alkaliphila TaxID=225762 RepID=UPI000349D7AC|nr:hypothetical protein [Nocardiopsis alkaliphila]